MELTSPVFAMGGRIPRAHARDGQELPPPLSWSGAPATTRTFALIVTDPDAPGGTFVHWLAWNIPGRARSLTAEKPAPAEGLNGYGQAGWGGPLPPSGRGAHRYVFELFALDAYCDLKPGASREQLEAAMHGHVLARARLMGKYFRE